MCIPSAIAKYYQKWFLLFTYLDISEKSILGKPVWKFLIKFIGEH